MKWQKQVWPGLAVAADFENAGHGNHDVKGFNFLGCDCLFNLRSTYRLG
jgi:hypothetical protein